MALSEFEIKRCEKMLDRFLQVHRPPEALRHQVDMGWQLRDQSVELFEIRPVWQDPGRRHKQAFAKATWVRTQRHWRVFWLRADLRWHRYEPAPTVSDLSDFLSLVEQDEYHCFRG